MQRISKKVWLILAGIALALAVTALVVCSLNKKDKDGELVYTEPNEVEVTAEDMDLYRERIGTDMDIKKAILIMFETEEECTAFIAEHGKDEDPLAAGKGIVPLMENGYYNIVGKTSIEEAFDALSDGEYSSVPVQYSNLYCYLKRLGVDSPTTNDEELKKLIQNERYQELKKEGD